MTKEITIDVEKLAEKDKDLEMLLNKIEKMDNTTNIAKETEPKKYDKAYVVEDDMLWEVFGDGYSKAQVIWDKENICELLNNLHQENQELQEKIMKVKQSNNHYYTEYYRIEEENEQLKKKNKALKEDINQSEKRVKHWMMLYGDIYDKMQKRRVSG